MKKSTPLHLAIALAALAAPLAAQGGAAGAAAMPGTIRVAASGEARGTPDQAWIDFGMETIQPTARAAGEQNARAMDRVVSALMAAGVARADVQTHDYNLYPEYQPRPDGQGAPTIRGYHATNVVTVRTDRITQVGALIDAALAAGANRADAIRFGIKNADALRAQALRQALDRGRAEAQSIAAGLGVRVGRVLDASTSSSPPRPMPVAMMSRAMVADAAPPPAPPTPVEAGEQTVTATVSLVFAIEGQ